MGDVLSSLKSVFSLSSLLDRILGLKAAAIPSLSILGAGVKAMGPATIPAPRSGDMPLPIGSTLVANVPFARAKTIERKSTCRCRMLLPFLDISVPNY